MSSNTKLNQINSNEKFQYESNDNINKEEAEKLNILFDDNIDLHEFITEKIEGFEGLEYNCNINENNKIQNQKESKKIKKKIKEGKKQYMNY